MGELVSELDGRRVIALGNPRLTALIGQQVELAYSRIDTFGPIAVRQSAGAIRRPDARNRTLIFPC